jgi:hypothetical protein
MSGDDQLKWVTRYVSERMSDVISTLEATFDQLDAILLGLTLSQLPPVGIESRNGVTLALQIDHDQQIIAHKNDVQNARANLGNLQRALARWADSAQTGNDAQ